MKRSRVIPKGLIMGYLNTKGFDKHVIDFKLKSFQLGFAVSSKIAVSMGVAPCNRPKHPISI